MTISRKQNKYKVDKVSLPAQTTIGVSLVTIEEYTIIQDEKAITIPVDDEIVYITVPSSIVNKPNGGSDWNAIAKLIEQEKGLRRTHWKIQSVWSCVPDHIAREIF
jgi:hypothetical protein